MGLTDPAKIIKAKEQEQAALNMCGGLLGNCYILTEVTENRMLEAISNFKKEKWFKMEIKKNFNQAKAEIHKIIGSSTRNSPTNSEYMREVADAMYEELEPDLTKLYYSIQFEIDKRKVEYSSSLAMMLTVDILLKYIALEYDDILEYMNTVKPAYYDTWYHAARCDSPTYWWNKGMQLFAKAYVPNDLDLNGVTNIQNGINVIQRKMHSGQITEAVKAKAAQYAEDGGGEELYNKSRKMLGIGE